MSNPKTKDMNPIQIVKKELVDGFQQSKWLPLITAYAALSGIIGPGIHFPLFHMPFIAIGLYLALKKGSKWETTAIMLLLYLPVNVMITQPAAVFNAWQRLALFAAVYVFLSPLLRGKFIGNYRKKLLIGLLVICVLLGLGSLACYFLGINYMPNQWDGSAILDYHSSAGGFGGLLYQSISLGMVCGLGMLYLFYRALTRKKQDRKWFYMMIALLALTILISSSRSALLSAIIGGLMMLYQSNKKNGKFIQVLMGLMLVLILTFPFWDQYTSGLEAKRVSDTELGTYGTRTQKWTARMAEFSSSPLYGIGFASVDEMLDVVGVGGAVEPGSSWLGILSMTGIIGFILFVIILIKPYQYLRSHPTPYNALLLGLFVFICTHMVSEGYIFAGGSSLCFIAWLIFGCCNDARYIKDRKIK